MLGYDFKIEYKPGRANQVADALSYVHENEHVKAPERYSAYLPLVSSPTFDLLETLRLKNTTCLDLVLLHKRFATGELSPDFSVYDGLLFFRHRYYVSSQSSLNSILLHEFHATPWARHVGIKRTLVRLASTFYWHKMRTYVEKFIAPCLTCQQIKHSTQALAELLQPLPILSLV